MAPPRLISLCLLGTSILLGRFCGAAALAADGQVHVLTEANFAEGVREFPYTFVEFYAPWCGHCKKLEPEWEQTAQLARAYEVPVAKVDAIAEEKLAATHGVQSFPTLFLFKGDPSVAAKYNGPRDAKSMAEWLGKWTEAAALAQPDATAEGLQAWAPTNKLKVIGLLSGQEKEDKALQEMLEAASFMLNPSGPGSEVPVALIALPGGEMAKLGITGVSLPCVALLRDFDFEDNTVIYEEHSKGLETFMAWVEQKRAPALIPATRETEQLFLKDIDPGKGIAILFGSDQSSAKEVHKLAVEMASSISSLKWVHAKQDEFGESLAKNVGLEASSFPEFVIWEFGETEDDDRVFKLSQQLGHSSFPAKELASAVRSLVEGWKAGSLSAEADPVISVTSDTFEEIVLDPSRDVLVEFFAPWCGHCKTLAPVYKELAKHYANDAGVAIVKVDATQHSHRSAEISSYPTLFFYPKSRKDAPEEVKFKANRDKQSLIESVEELRESVSSGNPAPVKKAKTTATPPPKKKANKAVAVKGSFKDVPCPVDADIFACSSWCEQSSSDSVKLVGTLGGKPCAEWVPNGPLHDMTTCTCYDEDFTESHLSCKPKCVSASAAGGSGVDDIGTCAAGDASCSAGGSTVTTTPTPYDDDDDIAADF